MSKPKPRIKGSKKACANKQRFKSLELAERAAKRGRWIFMQAYKCNKCSLYHYGHVPSAQLPKFAG